LAGIAPRSLFLTASSGPCHCANHHVVTRDSNQWTFFSPGREKLRLLQNKSGIIHRSASPQNQNCFWIADSNKHDDFILKLLSFQGPDRCGEAGENQFGYGSSQSLPIEFERDVAAPELGPETSCQRCFVSVNRLFLYIFRL
jgi:hypothetical protein